MLMFCLNFRLINLSACLEFFISSFYQSGAVETENRGMLWEKTRQALIYAYKNHYDDFDFFMKADDDTYVIVENLRFLLSKHDPNTPFLMGRRFNVIFYFLKNSALIFYHILLVGVI